MKKLIGVSVLSLLVGANVAYSQAPKTDDFADNLLMNPDFDGGSCYEGWEIEVTEVACNGGEGTVWLNHNNRAGDPAVKQTIYGLTPGEEYEIIVGWRGGNHGPIHGVKGAQDVFAIDLDGVLIHRLMTGPNFTDWMVNNRVADGDYVPTDMERLTFVATEDMHTLRFRGEVGLDGDVLLDWVQVKPLMMHHVAPNELQIYGIHSVECYSINKSRNTNERYYFGEQDGKGVIVTPNNGGMPSIIHVEYHEDNGIPAVMLISENTGLFLTTDANGVVSYTDHLGDGAIFYPKDNLAGVAEDGWASFESKLLPGNFLRHQGFILKVHPQSNDDLYRQDASFKFVDPQH